MKRFISSFIAILGLTLLAVFNASAASLEHAQSLGDIRYEWPVVNGLRIDLVCATENSLRSLVPVTFCAEGEMPRTGEVERDGASCHTVQTRRVEVSRNVMDVSCAEYSNVSNPATNHCIRYVRQSVKLGRVFFVAKFERRNQREVYLGDVPYEIPECRIGI